MPARTDPWLLVTLRRSGPLTLVDARSDRGEHLRGDAPSSADPALRVPEGLAALAAEALGRLPEWRQGPHVRSRVPLAVFLDVPRGLEAEPWEAILTPLLGVPPDRLQFVRLTQRKWVARAPFRLPLRILAVGTESLDALEGIREEKWFRTSEVQGYGLQIEFGDEATLATDLRRRAYDIVLGTERVGASLIGPEHLLPRAREGRPRLVMLLEETPEAARTLVSLPAGVAAIGIPPGASGDVTRYMTEFIHDIVHDMPLHEAIKAAGVTVPSLQGVSLDADPNTNQALRMSDSVSALHDDVGKLTTVSPGASSWFADRLSLASPKARDALAGVGKLFLDAVKQHGPVADLIDLAQSLKVDFQRETFGLLPLARAEAKFAAALPAFETVKQQLADLASNPLVSETLSEVQERRADITVDELGDGSLYRALTPGQTMAASQRYRIGFCIGQLSKNTILVEPPPPIDPLLPDPPDAKGHELEIALYPRDFTLESPRVVKLYLPRLGGSARVAFDVVAPAAPTAAECRLSIYHDNHLIQSFRINATVTATPQTEYTGPRPVAATLDFSRTARFGNLDSLGGRLMSIGANHSPGATHSLTLHKDGASRDVGLPQATIDDLQKRFRDILERNTSSVPDRARFPSDAPMDPTAEPTPEFSAAVRELALLGKDLYTAVMGRAEDELHDALLAVQGASDQTIQISRIDANFVLPWGAVYDRRMPKRIAGAKPARVCIGAPLPNGRPAPATPADAGCLHNPGEDVYCISGFWGIRHRIEQVISSRRDPPTTVARPRPPGVVVALGVDDDATTTLRGELNKNLSIEVREVQPSDVLVDILWDETRRPAVVAVLGHLDTTVTLNEPEGPRIRLFPEPEQPPPPPVPTSQWLWLDEVTDYQNHKPRWEAQPLPIIVLGACEAGATNLTTVTDFMTSFISVGAAAVISAEATVYSGFVARLIRNLTTDLLIHGKTLGASLQDFNRTSMLSGNPLPMVFTCCGSADLTIV